MAFFREKILEMFMTANMSSERCLLKKMKIKKGRRQKPEAS